MEERLKEKLQIYGRGDPQSLEVKLNLTFTAEGPIMHMMRQFLRESYWWDYTGKQETVQQDDEEDYNFLNSIIFESRFMKFFYYLSKKYIFAKKFPKLSKKLT